MKTIFTSIALFFITIVSINAQTLDEAKQLYLAGEYAKALPVIEAEYNAKPTDASLNQWYGVCLFETGGDLKKAEECLLVASKKRIRDSHLYLGRIYTTQYRFDEADKSFASFEKLLKKRGDDEPKEKLEEARKFQSRLRRMVTNTEDVQIIDSIVVAKKDFLSAYLLSTSGGKLDYFNNVFNANMYVPTTTYSNEKGSKIYYAQPDDNGDLRLFSMERLLDGYGNEKALSNDNFGLEGGNTNFPFMMLDGVTIYFAASDSESIGGYDLFVSRYNLNNDTYLTPERLGMPFNSPANDYLMVVDEEKGIGWFASDRFQNKDSICVYTFLPNDRVNIVDSEDMVYKAERAMITSIKATHTAGYDYSKELALAHKKPVAKKEAIRDFEFVINDKHTYYTLADFRSSTAQETYFKVIQKKKELKTLSNELELMRQEYSKSDASNRRLITNDILVNEKKEEQLTSEIVKLELNARNQEIRKLGETSF